jgi:phosphoglycolate phosphatase
MSDPTPEPRAIVFDLDGTLVDSLPDIVDAFREAFEQEGLEPPAEALVRPQIGLPLEQMYGSFAPSASIDALVTHYRRIYPTRFTQRSRPYPGVIELLSGLRERGYKLGVATTKTSDMAERFVTAMGLRDALDVVQGTDGFPHKPAPDVVVRALTRMQARGAFMVGDTVHDIEAGRAAGLQTFAVTWGTHDRATLERAAPDHLEETLTPLLALASR